jgi:hypothetical protein
VTDSDFALRLLEEQREHLAATKTVQRYLSVIEAIEELRGREAVKAVHEGSSLGDVTLDQLDAIINDNDDAVDTATAEEAPTP